MAHKTRACLLHITSSLKMGGAEQLLITLIKSMPQFEHVVIYVHEGPHLQTLRYMGVATYQVQGLLFRYDFWFMIRLWSLVRRLQPDCIHTLLWSANVAGRLVGKLLGIPVVSALHNNVDKDGFLRRVLDRWSMRYAKKVVAVSAGVVESLQSRDGFVPASKIKVITNGIDLHAIKKQADQVAVTREELGLQKEHFIIGSVGRFVPEKNYQLLIKSFARLFAYYPQARLVLVGIGPQEEMLKSLAKTLLVADKMVFVVGKWATGYYPLFDCFAMSSNQEGISLALLAAMSCGLPCVVTQEGGKHAVLQSNVDGLVVDAGDEEQLYRQLGKVIHDEQLRNRLGDCAQKTVEQRFSSEVMVAEYTKLFLEIMSR